MSLPAYRPAPFLSSVPRRGGWSAIVSGRVLNRTVSLSEALWHGDRVEQHCRLGAGGFQFGNLEPDVTRVGDVTR